MPRGVQLASLFMSGVETALAANDVCGAPIPVPMCCPWLFFDGKLFHFKLLKANNNTPLIDMCDGQVSSLRPLKKNGLLCTLWGGSNLFVYPCAVPQLFTKMQISEFFFRISSHA